MARTRPLIITCGDSYMSPVRDYPGTHFTEIIAAFLGADLVSLAKDGMSNHGIALAIDQALHSDPDLVFIGTTHIGRLIFPVKPNPSPGQILFDSVFIEHGHCVSSLRPGLNQDSYLISYPAHSPEPIADTLRRLPVAHSDEIMKALQYYILYLKDPDLDRYIEEALIYRALDRLNQAGCNYILVNDLDQLCIGMNFLNQINSADQARRDLLLTLDPIITKRPRRDPGYHTTAEFQQALADLLIEQFLPLFDLRNIP